MSNVTMYCDDCEWEYAVECTMTYRGFRGSYDDPPEPPEFDIDGPELCEECGANLLTAKNEEYVTDKAIQAMADDSPRPRYRRFR